MAKQADLLSVEEALAGILAAFSPLDREEVPLREAAHRILAASIQSPMNVPPFTNSSMDGFAVVSESTASASPDNPVVLPVAFHIAAGEQRSRTLIEGECARIMTGGPLPPGADAVVPFEEVSDRTTDIEIEAPVLRNACVRRAGQDIPAGAELLAAGTQLDFRSIGLLAAVGLVNVPVVRRPVVAILTTGDELVEPGTPLRPGEIYNSNSVMLAAAVTDAGGMPRILATARDNREDIESALQGASDADLLLTCAGASVGDFDYMTEIVEKGGSLAFWRVRVRPGKPLLFGSFSGVPVIGLPGNPTSGMVTFELFGRPAIRRMLGAPLFRPTLQVRLDDSIENGGHRRTYARARLHYEGGEYHATLAGPQDSAMLMPLAHADGLVIVPEERDGLERGELATMMVWRLPSDEN